jgi:hypothetical protein
MAHKSQDGRKKDFSFKNLKVKTFVVAQPLKETLRYILLVVN